MGFGAAAKLAAVFLVSMFLFRSCDHPPGGDETSSPAILLPEKDLRSLSLETLEIIWPQALDGATTGQAKFRVSVDRSGQVQEVLPLETANERTNDSAVRQIMKWKFKPLVRDGVPLEAESILEFSLNTRAFGPREPLPDEEARKLASNIVGPVLPVGSFPSGTTSSMRAAIDSEGYLIEVIAGDGPTDLFFPCYEALKKWHFHPIMQDGQPRPYRAEITFRVP